jgi:hypothetical protein
MADGEGVQRGWGDGSLGPRGRVGEFSSFFGFSFYSEFSNPFSFYFLFLIQIQPNHKFKFEYFKHVHNQKKV